MNTAPAITDAAEKKAWARVLSQQRMKLSAVVLIALAVLVGMLAVPGHREYSTIYPPASCASCTANTDQETKVHYGFPLSWLVLSKQTNGTTGRAVTERSIEYRHIAVDVAIWLWAIVCLIIMRRISSRLP